jgi:flagella basal body P-ring formation protein FlgA
MITVIATSVLAVATPTQAAEFHDLASIDRQVAAFTGNPTGSDGGASLPVDRRLKLAHCPLPLSLEWYGNARQTVLVQCPIAGGWRLFVPTSGTAAPAARAEPVVSRGEAVAIAIKGRGFTVSRQGEALEAGAIGDWIRVRPAGDKRDTIRARIIQPGKVALDLP